MKGETLRVMVCERGGGKTYQSIDWLRDSWGDWIPNRCVLVHSQHERERLIEEYDVPADQIISASSLSQLRDTNADVLIDNVDMLLQQLLGFSPQAITICGELYQPTVYNRGAPVQLVRTQLDE